jgi:superfamily II DNA or RNA helicase
MDISSNIVLTESEIEKLGTTLTQVKESLTIPNAQYESISRFGKSKWALSRIPKYICYVKEIGGRYVLPRYYFGTDMLDGEIIGEDYRVRGATLSSLDFLGTLRSYQTDFLADLSLLSNTGVLLEASCGSGKTVMGIYLSLMRGKKTLVLVPTYYLAKQWKERIEAFSKCSCQILTSKDSKIRTDADFTVAVLDLFSVRVLPTELVENIGTVVLDEAHRIGAETYMPILDEIPARNRIALTATFRRADGVHKILQYHFGTHYKMESRFPRPKVYAIDTGVTFECLCSKNKPYERALEFFDEAKIPYVETKGAVSFPQRYEGSLVDQLFTRYALSRSLGKVHTKEVQAFLSRGKEMQYATLDTYLNENSRRMKLTIRLIQACLDAGRTVLFLSKRKDTLKNLTEYFAKYKPMLIVSETNSRTAEEEAYLQNECRLVFGVTQLAKEGLDIDRLDTLIIHLPMKDTEQAVGRVSRLHDRKQYPLCFYLLDNVPMAWAVFKNAKKFFSINGEFVSVINLPGLPQVLRENRKFRFGLEDSE